MQLVMSDRCAPQHLFEHITQSVRLESCLIPDRKCLENDIHEQTVENENRKEHDRGEEHLLQIFREYVSVGDRGRCHNGPIQSILVLYGQWETYQVVHALFLQQPQILIVVVTEINLMLTIPFADSTYNR